MSEFLTNLQQRLGKDTEAALQANKKARIIDPAGFEWGFTAYGDHLVLFSPEETLERMRKREEKDDLQN